MIEAKNLTRRYGDFTAVRDVSFSIKSKSGITALLGPNGAGKTTTLRILTGYLKPTSGEISINGMSPADEAELVEMKKQMGYLAETTPLYPEMLVSEYLEFIGKVRGLDGERLEKSAVEMIDKLELGSHFYTPIGLLSKGFRQRVGLAGALIHKPEIIILDEPTSGLDPNQISQIRALIQELGKDSTLILSTHILQEVEDICERVIIINRGSIVADQPMSELRDSHSCVLAARGDGIETKLNALDLVKNCRREPAPGHPDGYGLYICELNENAPEKLFARIADAGWEVREFAPLSRSLEDIFRELTA